MNAKARVSFGLINHGWIYVKVDGGWQGFKHEDKYNGIVPDETRFPDMEGLINNVHEMGLKFGLYHAYIYSYNKKLGATSNNPEGKYKRSEDLHPSFGRYMFHWN